jgi:UDP-glucose 4-epimerase
LARYLVTGGAGFIGSNLVGELLQQGHTVRVLDNFSTGKRENLIGFEDQIELIEGDLIHLTTVREAVHGMDYVLHQGAMPSVPKSVVDPIGSAEGNINATLNVLVAARDAGVKRVVYASSSSIYGEQAIEKPKMETMTPAPISPYGVAKMAAERYCQVFYSTYGLETVALRYFNVFGPRQDPESQYAAVIPNFITALLANEPPVVYGDGEQTRDFTYVANVVDANLQATIAPADDVAGEVFNIAAGGQTSLNELLDMLQEITGNTIKPRYDPPRAGDIKHSRADISQAQQRMGFQPRIGFLEGLTHTVAWYRDQIRV